MGITQENTVVVQAASQCNLLEMSGQQITPQHGITNYVYDNTQGPRVALSSPAGTLFRNYYVWNGKSQFENQINTLVTVMQNLGLRLSGNNGLDPAKEGEYSYLNGYLYVNPSTIIEKPREEIQALMDRELRVGIQWNTPSLYDPSIKLCQVYSSALPLGDYLLYKNQFMIEGIADTKPKILEKYSELIKPFAVALLASTFKCTLQAGVIQSSYHSKRCTVYLTAVGGGVFSNPHEWIQEGLLIALEAFKDFPLDVKMVWFNEKPIGYDNEIFNKYPKPRIIDNTPPQSSPSITSASPEMRDALIEPPIYSGIYLSYSQVLLSYHIYNTTHTDTILIMLEGTSKRIYDLNLVNCKFLYGNLMTFHVTRDEYDFFISNIVNKKIGWSVKNKDNKNVAIPGTWFDNNNLTLITNARDALDSALNVINDAYFALNNALSITNFKKAHISYLIDEMIYSIDEFRKIKYDKNNLTLLQKYIDTTCNILKKIKHLITIKYKIRHKNTTTISTAIKSNIHLNIVILIKKLTSSSNDIREIFSNSSHSGGRRKKHRTHRNLQSSSHRNLQSSSHRTQKQHKQRTHRKY
jgi:hypothetical protein